MKVTPNFHMNGNCKEAISLYEKALNATVLYLYSYSDANPAEFVAKADERDLVYHSEIMIGTQRVMMVDDTGAFPPKGNTLSLVITFDTAGEVKKAFEAMSEGCQIISPMQSTSYSSCFVSFVDRFGVRWELMTEQPND